MTECVQAEEALRRSNRALSTISAINQALIRAVDEASLLRAVCRLLVEKGHYRMAWVGVTGPEHPAVVSPVAWAGHEDGYLDVIRRLGAATPAADKPSALSIHAGKPLVINNVANMRATSWQQDALKRGYASAISLPLIGRGQPLAGSLNIYSAEADAFSESEVMLLGELADDLAYGIVSLRDRDGRMRAEAALQQEKSMIDAIIDNTPAGIAYLDNDFILRRCNPAYADFIRTYCAITPEQALGMCYFDYVPGSRLQVEEVFRKVRDTGKTARLSRFPLIIQRDGREETSYWDAGIAPAQDSGGSVRGIILLAQDVTGLELSQGALRESEAKLLKAQHIARMGFLDWDLRTNEIYLSEEVRRLYGLDTAGALTTRELVSRSVHPDDVELVGRDLQMAIRGERGYDIDHRIVRPDGEVLWVHAQAELSRAEDGTPVSLLGTIVDVTERKRAEAAVRASEARLRTTLRSIGDGVISTDVRGHVEVLNPVAEEMTGWSEGEAKGRPITEVFTIVNEETRGTVGNPVERVLREGVVVGLANHTLLVARNGAERPIADSGAPIHDEGGATTGAVLVFRDRTEERRAQRTLQEAEDRFRTFFDNAPIGNSMHATDGKLLLVNPAFASMLGCTVDEVRSGIFVLPTHPEDAAESREVARALFAGERDDATFEKRYVGRDGLLIWALVTARLHRNSEGKPLYVLSHVMDITRSKQAEDSLRHALAYNRSLIEASLDPLVTIGPDGRITDVNRASEAATGRTRGELIGTDFCGYFKDPDKARAGYRQVYREGSVQDYALEIRHRDGHLMPVMYNASVYRDEAGNVAGVFAAARDISERLRSEREIREFSDRLEQRVRERTAELEAANKELEAFSYSVSHDLRAPLRAIDGFARILVEDHQKELNPEGERVCSVIRENTARMSRLIDDLLAFSRLGRTQMQISSIDMQASARSVFHELVSNDARARIDFEVGILPRAWGDPTLLRQVWVNLLGNAIKFTSKAERAEIHVSGRSSGDEVVFAVRDNGVGFDMQYVDKLFGVFQRLHSAKEFEGTGVGLAIVQRIVRRHGGRVWAEGQVDKGASFYFALPRKGA